jgi:SAM-dependent methyltransferase
VNPKRIVTRGYDLCGPEYNEARSPEPDSELKRFIEALPEKAPVLDIGCGGGVPVTAALARRGSAIGVDISGVQIEQARRRVPEAEFLQGDIMEQSFEPGSFEGVVCFYALFHLPREEHRALLERVAIWLAPGGHLLITVGASGDSSYTEDDFFGATMFWSQFKPSWYENTLQDLGFTIVHRGVVGHGFREAAALPPERHPAILARRG